MECCRGFEDIKDEISSSLKDDRAFSLLHQELPQILVLCFP